MLSDFIKNTELKNEEEFVFFGGSFNPWHAGHSSCIELMPSEKKIIVIPDHSPFKEITQKISTIEDIQVEINKLPQTTFLFDGFYKANKKNPTFYWMKELHDSFPEKKLSLLIGFDSFISIHKWTEANKLISLLDTLYIAGRLDDESIKQEQIHYLQKINPTLKLHFLGGHPHENLSSTIIRKQKETQKDTQ